MDKGRLPCAIRADESGDLALGEGQCVDVNGGRVLQETEAGGTAMPVTVDEILDREGGCAWRGWL